MPEQQSHETGPWPFLTNNFGDKYLYEVNRNTLNKLGAHATHQQRLAPLLAKEKTLFIIVGSDSGTLISFLDSYTLPDRTSIIIFELPKVLDKIREQVDITKERPGISILEYHDDFEEIAECYDFKDYIYINNIILTTSLAALDGYLPEYKDLLLELQIKLKNYTWRIHFSLGNEAFLKKQLENIADNRTPANCLKNIFPGKTAVLMAGGPSLDDLIPWIRKNRENLVLVAVSRICRRLAELNLAPDIIFSIDPHPVSFDVSREMFEFWDQSLLVNVNHIVSTLLGQWRGRHLYLGNRLPWESKLNIANLETSGPNVANVALQTTMDLGVSQIVFAGLDLCFKQDGTTYARGSNEFQAGPQFSDVSIHVETYGGWQAETTSAFFSSTQTISHQALAAEKKGVKLINPAPGAAKIEGIDHLPTDQITIESLEQPAQQTIFHALPDDTAKERADYSTKIYNELTYAYGQLLHIKKLTIEALHCNDGLFGRKGIKRDFKFKKRMDKIENRLNSSKYKKFTYLVKSYGIREFLKINRVNTGTDWSEKEIETSANDYYTAYRKSTEKLLKLVKKSKERCQARVEERKPHPDFQLLAKQWRKDLQPGRVLLWQDLNPEAASSLSSDDKKTVRELEEMYISQLSKTETNHWKRTAQESDISKVLATARLLLWKQDQDGLQYILRQLEKHPSEEGRNYSTLITGFLFDLAGEIEKALEMYQEIFTTGNEVLIEEALKRVASISLARSDEENALLAFESLASLSPFYLPQYADLLRILGRHQDALKTYLDYIEKVPQDTVTMVKIGFYYNELNIKEGACAMFQHILTVDPENQTAKEQLEQLC